MPYIKTNKGFVHNAPTIQFERCDGKRFFSDTGSAANMSSTDNTTPVYGGWGKTPLGYITGDSTAEISFTDAMFYEDLYSIGGTGNPAVGDTSIKGGGQYQVVAGPKVELPFQVNTSNVQINGLALGTTTDAGKFTVTYNDTTKVSTIEFNGGDVAVGDVITVTYERRVANASVTTITTIGGTARGSLTLTWPVMSAGDDCTVASIIGYYHLKVPRVMVTSRASLDTSRGSAMTPQITFSAIDAHRGDNKWYEFVWEKLVNGAISTDYSEPFVWDSGAGDPEVAKLMTLAIGALTLTPTFDANVNAYTTTLGTATSTVSATGADDASVAIEVNGTGIENGATANFNEGNNTVVITASKPGCLSNTYIVTVVRTA